MKNQETKNLALHGRKVSFQDPLGDEHIWGVLPHNRLNRKRLDLWVTHYTNLVQIYTVLYNDLYKFDPLEKSENGEPVILPFTLENYTEDELSTMKELMDEWRINMEWCCYAVLWDPKSENGHVPDAMLSILEEEGLRDIIDTSNQLADVTAMPLKSSGSSNVTQSAPTRTP